MIVNATQGVDRADAVLELLEPGDLDLDKLSITNPIGLSRL